MHSKLLLTVCWGIALLCPLTSLAWPTFSEVRAQWRSSDVLFLDRHGELLERVRVDPTVRKRDWVRLEDTSPALRYALLVSEDKRFYQHSGVDWSGVAAAAWGNLWNSKTRGASTLTMQLAGLLDKDLKATRERRSVWQKMGQAWSSKSLEQQWSKAQILEAYLNLVSFRGEQTGLGAMSASLFGKLPSGLDAQESAIASALIRAPNAAPETVAHRACVILRDMNGPQADCSRLTLETHTAFARNRSRDTLSPHWAPHFAQRLLTQQKFPAGSQVRTTLDADLQRYASTVLRRQLSTLTARNVQDGALVVLDNQSGDILAWVGSSGPLSAAPDVDGVTALRQAGSTLKPLLYQLALEGHWLSAASLLSDSPLDVPTGAGLYAPQNYSKDFKGLVSVRTALASSLNIPAVRTIAIVSPQKLRDRLLDLGLSSLQQDGDFYGDSLALGAADVRLIELSNAYRTLAQGGRYSAPRWTVKQAMPASRRVTDAGSSFIIADILADRTARARTFGLENVLSTHYWSAVKTGTSKDMRDNWALGFSRQYTVGVWVGNASGAPMWDVSGMHGAAPSWAAVLNYLQRHAPPSRAPTAPVGVVASRVSYDGHVEAPRREWFLAGTERSRIMPEHTDTADRPTGIVSPLDGSLYAIDPDIPPANQRLVFQASGVSRPVWWLDGKRVGHGAHLAWFPWPGRHQLELRDSGNRVLERVSFTVRGAVAQTPTKPPA